MLILDQLDNFPKDMEVLILEHNPLVNFLKDRMVLILGLNQAVRFLKDLVELILEHRQVVKFLKDWEELILVLDNLLPNFHKDFNSVELLEILYQLHGLIFGQE